MDGSNGYHSYNKLYVRLAILHVANFAPSHFGSISFISLMRNLPFFFQSQIEHNVHGNQKFIRIQVRVCARGHIAFSICQL